MVVYVTAIAPYILITIIVIRGFTLEGSSMGLKLYLTPNATKLKDFQLWADAGMQVFYSLGPVWGGMLTIASYNDFKNNYLWFTFLMPLICGMTSFYCGLGVFSVIGNLLKRVHETDLERFTVHGPGLAFVVYPYALSTLPGAPIWSILFFMMILSIALDTQFVTLDVYTSAAFDHYPQLRNRTWLTTLVICLFQVILGLIFATRSGFYFYYLIDWYGSPFTLVLVAVFEFFALGYLVGPRRLMAMAEQMMGPINMPVKVFLSFGVSCSGILAAMFAVINTFISFSPPIGYNGKPYPEWTVTAGIGLALISIVELPIVALYMIYKYRNNLRGLILPTADFMARSLEYRNQSNDSSANTLV